VIDIHLFELDSVLAGAVVVDIAEPAGTLVYAALHAMELDSYRRELYHINVCVRIFVQSS
jgi:hypothetical protein